MNSYKIGIEVEKKKSEIFHKSGVPFLISPLTLRELGLGQIDLARLEKTKDNRWVIEITEVKSGDKISKYQVKRLVKSANFLGELLNLPAKLDFSLNNLQKTKSFFTV